MRVVAVLVLCSACAEEAARPRETEPASSPMRFWQRSLPIGACDPVEYTVGSTTPHDVRFRVDLTPDGRAAAVEPLDDDASPEARLAREIVRQAFHCRHPLAADAARVLDAYALHFRPVEPPRSRGSCGQGVTRPESLDMMVSIDENGDVVRAWPISPPNEEFVADAVDAIQRCRFTPARVGGVAVSFVLRTRFTYEASGDNGKPFDRVYPAWEHTPVR